MFSSFYNYLVGNKAPKTPEFRTTDLHLAVKSGRMDQFWKVLEDYGTAAIDVVDEDQYTALGLAIMENHTEMVEELMARNANPLLPKNRSTHQAVGLSVLYLQDQDLSQRVIAYSSNYRRNRTSIEDKKKTAIIEEKEMWIKIDEDDVPPPNTTRNQNPPKVTQLKKAEHTSEHSKA